MLLSIGVKMSVRARLAVVLLFLVASVPFTTIAQRSPSASGATLHGFVVDPDNALIPGATVTLKSATAPTFAVYVKQDVNISAGANVDMDVKMALQEQMQQVNVTTDAVSLGVDPESNASSTVITGTALDALSDDADELQTELQALAGPSAGPNGGQIYIDGFTGGQLPPKSSILAIRINQNPFSAEYDKLGYGRIEVFTKPGTDQYHGQFSVMGNSSYFNSTSPFATNPPSYDSTQYSANFGGPVGKKASFIINAERRNIGDNAVVNALLLTGPFSQAVLAPQVRTTVSPRIDYQ